MLFTPRQATGTPSQAFGSGPGPAAGTYVYPWSPAAPDAQQSSVRPTADDDDLDDDDLDDDDETETNMVSGFEPTSYRGSGDRPTA